MIETKSHSLSWAWRVSLLFFVVAGVTGLLFRTGMAYGWTAGLDLVNIRHAHSHLMYFGWATPALFALIARQLGRITERPTNGWIQVVLIGCFAAALISYPLFLRFGYTLVDIGDKRLPISVIGSTFNMLGWYLFAAYYIRMTRGVKRTRALVLWDVAVTFMILSTLGAGMLALAKPLGIQSDSMTSALTHIFLDYFSEGWFVLGVLGLAYAGLPERIEKVKNGSILLLALGLPFTFALGMPAILVPPGLQTLARLAAALVGIGLLLLIRDLWTRNPMWRIPLLFLGLKASSQVVVAVLPGMWLPAIPGMRILYLHLMLLGFVTLGLVVSAESVWGRSVTTGRVWMSRAVALLIAALFLLTPLWPPFLRGAWVMKAALFASIPAVVSAIIMAASSGGRGEDSIEEREAIAHSYAG